LNLCRISSPTKRHLEAGLPFGLIVHAVQQGHVRRTALCVSYVSTRAARSPDLLLGRCRLILEWRCAQYISVTKVTPLFPTAAPRLREQRLANRTVPRSRSVTMLNRIAEKPSRAPCGHSCGRLTARCFEILDKALILLVGAGRFERPTPCAQGGFGPLPKVAYFQRLSFQ
jgi:hypothetical protein